MMPKPKLQMDESLDDSHLRRTSCLQPHSEEPNVLPSWFSLLQWFGLVGGETGGWEGMREVDLLLRFFL